MADEKLTDDYVCYLRALSERWSGMTAARLLTGPVVDYLLPRFKGCSTPIKVRVITSLLYADPGLLERKKKELSAMLLGAESDPDDWVRKIARLLQPFVATGKMDVKEVDSETAYKVIQSLDDNKTAFGLHYYMKRPLEHHLMCDVTQDCLPQSRSVAYRHENFHFRPTVDFDAKFGAPIVKAGMAQLAAASSSHERRRPASGSTSVPPPKRRCP